MTEITALGPGPSSLEGPTLSADELRLVERRLTSWRPADPKIPVATQKLEVALMTVEASLRPVELKRLTVELEATLALWATPDDFERVGRFYLEALIDVPLDLVLEALKQVRLTYGFNCMPKPADFRKAVIEQLSRRRCLKGSIGLALREAKRRERDQEPIDGTERERVRVRFRALAADLAEKATDWRRTFDACGVEQGKGGSDH